MSSALTTAATATGQIVARHRASVSDDAALPGRHHEGTYGKTTPTALGTRPQAVPDRALGTAATVGRFSEGDLLSFLDHQGEHDRAEPIRRSETHSLQPGTSAWSRFGSA